MNKLTNTIQKIFTLIMGVMVEGQKLGLVFLMQNCFMFGYRRVRFNLRLPATRGIGPKLHFPLRAAAISALGASKLPL